MCWIKNKVTIVWEGFKIFSIVTNILWILLLCVLLMFVFILFMWQSIFAFKVIYVRSINDIPLRHLNVPIIRAFIIPYIHKDNFFTIDLNKTSIIFKSIPWVRKVIVYRKWPNILIVTIEEHDVLGIWGKYKDERLLSIKGDIFTANLLKYKDSQALLVFQGPEGSEKEIARHCIQFRNWLAPTKLRLSSIVFSNLYGWRIILNNSMTIELGRSENNDILKERITKLVFVYPQLIRHVHGKILNIDLRYQHGFALAIR